VPNRLPAARVIAIVLAAASCSAQETPPVFRAGSRLVEVSVAVLDHKGSPVEDLKSADFTLSDAGKSRPIAFFRFEGAPAPVETHSAPNLPGGVFTNRVGLSGGPPRNITALVLDSLNTPQQQSVWARAQMMRYLKALSPDTRMAIFQMGQQLRILYDFTDDAAALRAHIEKATLGTPLETVTDFDRSVIEAEQFVNMFAGDPTAQKAMEEIMRQQLDVEMAANAAARRSRMERSLAAMEALGHHLAGIPGRKNLVWIGAGFSMFSLSVSRGGPGTTENFEDKVRQTSRRLAQQGIALYIVDSKGLETAPASTAEYSAPMPVRGRGRFEPQMDAERVSNDPRSAMDLMASVTGGRYIHGTNDLTAGLKQVTADLRGAYTLGFYATDAPDDKWHKLRVRVARSGVTVRYRDGYTAEAEPLEPVEWSNNMWRAVLVSPIGSSVIPLTATCQLTDSGELSLSLTVGANQLSFRPDGENLNAGLQMAIAERDAEGRSQPQVIGTTVAVPKSQWDEVSAKGLHYERRWKLAPGATALRVIVRDTHTGQYGSLDIPLAKALAASAH
jgi:VWFA-related protein